MPRQTSIDVYHDIVNSGLVNKRQLLVYNIIDGYGPMTAGEVHAEAKGCGVRISSNGFGSRISELHRMGVIENIGTRPCRITGRVVTLWRVTNQRPTPLPRPVTRAERIRQLEEENERLRGRIVDLERQTRRLSTEIIQ